MKTITGVEHSKSKEWCWRIRFIMAWGCLFSKRVILITRKPHPEKPGISTLVPRAAKANAAMLEQAVRWMQQAAADARTLDTVRKAEEVINEN